ncbi:hypothetical protein HDU96_004741 [Phlyctochytrium bullatum]|nr:hypothetical protein HDU96_004741 [Phlyctochytrium bullatum]
MQFLFSVEVNGKKYVGEEWKTTIKGAKNYAAQVALDTLCPSTTPPTTNDIAELFTACQKLGKRKPVFEPLMADPDKPQGFLYRVIIGDDRFQGDAPSASADAAMQAAARAALSQLGSSSRKRGVDEAFGTSKESSAPLSSALAVVIRPPDVVRYSPVDVQQLNELSQKCRVPIVEQYEQNETGLFACYFIWQDQKMPLSDFCVRKKDAKQMAARLTLDALARASLTATKVSTSTKVVTTPPESATQVQTMQVYESTEFHITNEVEKEARGTALTYDYDVDLSLFCEAAVTEELLESVEQGLLKAHGQNLTAFRVPESEHSLYITFFGIQARQAGGAILLSGFIDCLELFCNWDDSLKIQVGGDETVGFYLFDGSPLDTPGETLKNLADVLSVGQWRELSYFADITLKSLKVCFEHTTAAEK